MSNIDNNKIGIEKNNVIIAVLYIVAGLVLSLGLATVFKACPTDKMVMRCHYSTVTVIILSVLLFTAGITYIFAENLRTKIIVSFFAIETAIVDILIPKFLIGGCKMNTMRCQSITFPVIYLVSIILLVITAVNIIYLLSRRSKEGAESAANQ